MPFRLLIDDDLAEAATFHCATRRTDVPPAALRRYHAARERAYGEADPDRRAEAFGSVHAAFFQEWGLEQRLRDALGRFPLLTHAAATVAFRQARTAAEESADLHVNPAGERHALVAVRPERVATLETLAPFLHHELQHLEDMVDPAFGYVPDLGEGPLTASQQRLVRDRFRLLWNITVDGRLHRRGQPTVADETRRRSEFLNAFGFLDDAEYRFASLWNEERPRQTDLLARARDPRGLLGSHRPAPGATCPLCGFPTFTWAEPASLPAEVRARIGRDFPTWLPEEAPCARCAEVYQATAGLRLPGPVLV